MTIKPKHNRKVSIIKKQKPARHPNQELVPEGERVCPICKLTMNTQSYKGVSVDICEDHGVWLDTNELQKIVDKTRKRDRRITDRKVANAKLQGMTFGWLALLFD